MKISLSKITGPTLLAFAAITFTSVVFAGAVSADAPRKYQGEDRELQEFLARFYKDSRTVMNEVPKKKDPLGAGGQTPFSTLSKSEIQSREYLKAKNEMRERLMSMAPLSVYSESTDLSGVSNLVQVPSLYNSLDEMESHDVLDVTVKQVPWSDSYWPIYRGMTATRYADPDFPNDYDWQVNLQYVLSKPVSSVIADGDADNLAPSEKYDYLVGDDNATLTNANWGVAKAMGNVATWEGICDGWSAASTHFVEPLNAITVQGAQGRNVRFYPADVKALASLLWAKSTYPISFLGTRCNLSDPPVDANGRIISADCQGTNAGTWHLAVVNQLGQAGRALVIDASLDAEIWNYPLWKYHYSYFNPQTMRPSSHWQDAVIPIEQFTVDKFKAYRSPNAKYIAGINMNLTYMIEDKPTHSQGDQSIPQSVQYVYDLELDANKNIIGGEWYSNIHPDFIWSPSPGANAVSIGDSMVNDPASWTGTNGLTDDWTKGAETASTRLQPLAAIVQKLVTLSNQ